MSHQTAGGDASEDEAVAQKLLEIALERFEKEQAAGASTAEFLYHYASCLVTVGAHVLVVDMIEQAIALFKQAETAKPTAEDAKGANAILYNMAVILLPDMSSWLSKR